jgi:hypothetical protein
VQEVEKQAKKEVEDALAKAKVRTIFSEHLKLASTGLVYFWLWWLSMEL